MRTSSPKQLSHTAVLLGLFLASGHTVPARIARAIKAGHTPVILNTAS